MDVLDSFYDDLVQGISVADFLVRYPLVVDFAHNTGQVCDMRLARGRVKRLCDEISPARQFARAMLQDSDLIQFPLDSGPIDCNVLPMNGKLRSIQITIAQARARLNVMRELNEKGLGRGYLGITDDRPTAEFIAAMSRRRVTYSTAGAQKTLCKAIDLCLSKKTDPKGADTLLIEAPLNVLPQNRLAEIVPELTAMTNGSMFSEVYLVGGGEHHENCYRLK